MVINMLSFERTVYWTKNIPLIRINCILVIQTSAVSEAHSISHSGKAVLVLTNKQQI